MKYSYKWLKELSETEKNVDEIAEMLLTHSFEVEGVEDLSKGLKKVVIGEILAKEKHPGADKLHVATVDIGEEKLQIVCGAPNLEVGQKVVVALAGSVLPGEFKIKKSKIRGVESNGMICAEDELGIGTDHEGIMVLEDNAPIGEKFVEYAGLNDSILEIDILPNRGHDALSYIGMANEIRTLENRELIPTDVSMPKIDDNIDITIDTERCNRYIGMKIEDVQVMESPGWLKVRLAASDIQSINTVVDITNYVMLETGQPLHAFDADKVHNIGVRQAHNDEKLILLDDTKVSLDDEDIVITENDRTVALAGVMGGKDSSISDDTKNIILESASFNATSVRFTQRKYNLHTNAAYRFERNLDANVALAGAVRAKELFEEICGGTVTAYTDKYPRPQKKWSIELSLDKVTKLLGVEIARDDILHILTSLGAELVDNEDCVIVTPPTMRLDLRTAEDLIEEIGRIYGYDKIEKKSLKEKVQTPVRNEKRFFERILKDVFVHNGFNEVRGYSFYAVDDARAMGLDDEKHISLINPMNPEQAIMRRSLVPTLLHFAKKNLSYFDCVQICEIGRIYDPTDSSLPDERLMFGATAVHKGDDASQFYELKGVLETLFAHINIGVYYFDDVFDANENNIPNLHPSRRALIKTEDGSVLGWIGEVDKKANKYFGLKKNRAAICEIDITQLLQNVQSENFFEPLSRYPFVARDISLIVERQTRVADVERLIYDAGGNLTHDVDLFDLYENSENEERSMAFHIVFGTQDRTLTTEEVDQKMTKIIKKLEQENIQIKK
ncbi:MAG: phenylalanine--tRNA ligase subunit beta [Candidatus Moraniibacteriota bacterium]|nr:MAG: phenylalanine--tRNA ligase subunit beta [Candidatus Moranbacteria bacterium]